MNAIAPAGAPQGRASRPDDDHELLPLLRSGDAKAYERLMRRTNRLLFRAARGIVGNDAEAQDAVQEAYLRAFLSLAAFRGDASLATWLVRIVINQALAQQRKRGRLVPWDEHSPEEQTMAEPGDSLPAVEHDSPESVATRNELRRQLEQAIDLLPPIYRCVFILRAVQGMSVEDTAAALEVSCDVVKTRYLRARGLLRARLGGDPPLPLSVAHDFLGRRCDETVRHVLAQLRARGVIRDQ
jgi:RNA polymerase sigma-70 factor (ECF subfamily)